MPLLPILVSFIVGIIISAYDFSTMWVIAIIAIAVATFFRGYATIGICLASLAIGWIDFSIQAPKPLSETFINAPHTHTAIVQSTAESETSRHLIVEIEGIGRCRVTSPSFFPIIEAGDIITFTSTLSTPINQHDLPDEWDLESFMYHQGIVGTAYIQPENLAITGHDSSLIWRIKRLQTHVVSLIGASQLDSPTCEFLIATITGDDSLLAPENRKEFASAGLAHILALSGLHVGIIAIVISIILFPLTLLQQRNARIIITIILLWVYAIATGLSPSVTRAVIMASIYFLGTILQRRHSSMNAMCCAALLILLFDPMAIYSVGFQLTFMAVASILLFANRLNPINPRRKILHYIFSLASLSCAAMLGTGIIVAYYFHNFPIYFIIGNIFVIMILPFLMGGGALLVILAALGCDPLWLCDTLNWIYNIIAVITKFSATLPGAEITGIYFPAWIMIPYYAAIASLLLALIYRRLFWVLSFIILAISTIAFHYAIKPQYPIQEYFFPRNTYHTDIIARDTTTMYLFTSAPMHQYDEIIELSKTRYRDYMARREVDTIILVTDTFKSDLITRYGRNIVLAGQHYIIIDDNNDIYTPSSHPNYALVCRGFRGDILELYDTIKPDTIILSNDLHPKRRNRYHNECEVAGIPVLSIQKKQ